MEDADTVIISFGCSVRSSRTAVDLLRKEGVKAGMLQLVTVWPMPEKPSAKPFSRQRPLSLPNSTWVSWLVKSANTMTMVPGLFKQTAPMASSLPRRKL